MNSLSVTPDLIKAFNLKLSCSSFKGHTSLDYYQTRRLLNKEYWQFDPDFSDGFRFVAINCEEHAIFTFTEGDLCLELFDNAKSFYARLLSATEFYKKN
jgi:hypothetical protein